MIVIPPCRLQEEYFRGMAERSWNTSLENHKENCDSLKAENNTLVVTCKVEVGGGMESTFQLHYRYFKKDLYCFVEEEEPREIK